MENKNIQEKFKYYSKLNSNKNRLNDNVKIWTKTEMNKGDIPSDKVRFRGINFERIGIGNFIDLTDFRKEYNKIKYNDETRKSFVNFIIDTIRQSDLFKLYAKNGELTHLYLNINVETIDVFVNR